MAGLNSDTKLLLHLNGSNGATSTDDATGRHSTINFNGTAQLSTAQKKWGSASLLLDGDSDLIDIPDSPDWDIFGSVNDLWTVDFQVKHNTFTNQAYISQSQGAPSEDNVWNIFNNPGEFGIVLSFRSGGVDRVRFTCDEYIGDTNWHHVALVILGNASTNVYGVYLDGNQIGYASDSDIASLSGPLNIGRYEPGGLYLDGYMDEIRFQKSNYFNANPNSGKTDTIIVPTAEYSAVALSKNQAIIIT